MDYTQKLMVSSYIPNSFAGISFLVLQDLKSNEMACLPSPALPTWTHAGSYEKKHGTAVLIKQLGGFSASPGDGNQSRPPVRTPSARLGFLAS